MRERVLVLLLVLLVVITTTISLYAHHILLEYNTLASKYKTLKNEYKTLRNEHIILKNEYERLSLEYANLTTKYRVLEINYTELKNKFSNLTERYLSLVKRYRELETKYTRIKQIIEVRVFGSIGEEEVKAIICAVDPSSVEHVIEDLDISEHMSDKSKVKAVMDWLMLNTMYMPDYHIPVPVGDSIFWKDNYITLPNETLARGGGDCEDLALLAYALLQNVFEEERVWIIGWKDVFFAHWGVLLKGKEGWCIIDPAGRYVTGVEEISFRLRVLDTRGWEYTVRISPIEVDPDLKSLLILWDFTQLEYKGRVEFSSLEDVVRMWLKHWESPLGLDREIYMVANVEKVMFFDSTKEFLDFMEG